MRLDLHGKRHHEVPLLVENFILLNQSEVHLTILCGNSQRMIDIVFNETNKIGCDTVAMDVFGRIVVRRI